MVREFVNAFLLVFAGLFPIINPLGNAPIFLTLTRQCTDKERHMLAWRVAVNGFLLLLGSLLIGSHTDSGRRTRLGFLCGREAGRLVRHESRRQAMARVAGHLSVEDLEAGFRSARDPGYSDEAGRGYRSKAGRCSDVKPATILI